MSLRFPIALAFLVLAAPLADAQSVAPAPAGAVCSPDQQPTGDGLGKQLQVISPSITQLAVSPVTNFAGLWKVITDTFGPPPPDVVADPTVIKSLQVVWFIDPADPTASVNADVFAFDSQNCYVIDIGIDETMFSLITPFTPMPTLGNKP